MILLLSCDAGRVTGLLVAHVGRGDRQSQLLAGRAAGFLLVGVALEEEARKYSRRNGPSPDHGQT
jgi:hypothetical protein